MKPIASIRPRQCILIVTRSRGDASLLQVMLRDLGPTNCITTNSLEEAQGWLESDIPDAVLLDLGRSKSQGLERLATLHALARRAPIVVVSGDDDDSLRTKVLQRGAVDFVPLRRVHTQRLARSLRHAINPSCSQLRHADADLRTVLNDVCRRVHRRHASDVHIILEFGNFPATVVDSARFGACFEHLLVGLSAVTHDVEVRGLKLHLRTGSAINEVLVTLEAFASERAEAFRTRVMSSLVGQRSDRISDHDLSEFSRKLHLMGGSLRFRVCHDGGLWVQTSVPLQRLHGHVSSRPLLRSSGKVIAPHLRQPPRPIESRLQR